MSNFAITSVAWLGLALHLVVGILTMRTAGLRLLVPAVNLIIAACVLAYWVPRWYGYLFRGIGWSASDQLIPLYAVFVSVLAGGTLAGRYFAVTLNWLVFAFHAVVFVGAVLFVTFFRMKMF
jgi:hypothetical protein